MSSIKSSSTGWCFNFSVAGVPGIEDLLPLAILKEMKEVMLLNFYYYVIDMEEELETSKRICIKNKEMNNNNKKSQINNEYLLLFLNDSYIYQDKKGKEKSI